MAKVEIELSDISNEDIERQVVAHLKEVAEAKLKASIDEQVTTIMADFVDRVVTEEIRERIRKELATLIENGWRRTDGYGFTSPRYGEKHVTLAERLHEALEGNAGTTRDGVKGIAKEIITAKVTEWLKEMSVAQRLRVTVDEVIQAKLAETLKTSLGLR